MGQIGTLDHRRSVARHSAEDVRASTSHRIGQIGKMFFAISMAVIGVQLFIVASGLSGPAPSPPWDVHGRVWAYIASIIAIGASIALFTPEGRIGAAILTLLTFARALVVYAPGLGFNMQAEDNWTHVFELLAPTGTSLMLVGSRALWPPVDARREREMTRVARVGAVLFACSLVVFGVEHFLSARGVASMIPGWIPWHLFWAYFVGVAFFASAAAILTRIHEWLAATMLSIMFLLWVLLLWLPAIAAAPSSGIAWTSAFVTLAMSGGAAVLTAATRD